MNAQPDWLVIAAVFLVSLACSAFFSGCETGTMSLNRARLLRSDRAGDDRGRRLEGLLRRIEDPILTCLIGTNLFNVLSSAVVTVALTARYGQRGEWYALAVVSVLVILFGEILPKVLYREYPERLMLLSEPLLSLSMRLTAPLRWVLSGYTDLWRRLLPPAGEEVEFGRRNLAALLLTNTVPAADDQRFANVLGRYLKLEAQDVAAFARPLGQLVTVAPDATVAHCLQVAASSGFSRLPVQDGDDLPAFIRVRDLLFLDREIHGERVPRRLWSSLLVLDGRMSPYEVFEEMRGQDRQLAVVAGPHGNPTGMITLEDLIEAVVGSITDEFDRPSSGAATQGETR